MVASLPSFGSVSPRRVCCNKMDTFLLQCTTRNVNAHISVSTRTDSGVRNLKELGSQTGESAVQIRDQIVWVFETYGQAQ